VEKGPWTGVLSEALSKYRSGDYESALLIYLDAAEQGFEVAVFNAAYLLHHVIATEKYYCTQSAIFTLTYPLFSR
jgi:hypothetical protein